MSGVQLIDAGETDSWDPDFDSFYCDVIPTSREPSDVKESNNDLSLLCHIVDEIENNGVGEIKNINQCQLRNEESIRPKDKGEMVDLTEAESSAEDLKKPELEKKTKRVSFRLPDDDDFGFQCKPQTCQEKQYCVEKNASEDDTKKTCTDNDLEMRLATEKTNSWTRIENISDKCSCCMKNPSNFFNVPELTEILRNLQVVCCPNCNPGQGITQKVYNEEIICRNNSQVSSKQSILSYTNSSHGHRKRNKLKEDKTGTKEKSRSFISEGKLSKRNSVKSESKYPLSSTKQDSDATTRTSEPIKVDPAVEKLSKSRPLDHHVKDSSNPKLLLWLKEKNKDLRKKRKDERKQKKEERKIRKEIEKEQEERRKESDKKVNEWLSLKRKEFKFTKRAKNSKIAPENDGNNFASSKPPKKVPDGYFEVRTFSPSKMTAEKGSNQSDLKIKQLEAMNGKKSSKTKKPKSSSKWSNKPTEETKSQQDCTKIHTEKKRKSYNDWSAQKRKEFAKRSIEYKRQEIDNKIEESLVASERRRRFKEIQNSKARVDSGLKKAMSNSKQVKEIQSKSDSNNGSHKRRENSYKFKPKESIENDLKLRPEPQGCDNTHLSSCTSPISENDSITEQKEKNKKDIVKEFFKASDIKMSDQPKTSSEYLNEDLSRVWMVSSVKSSDQDQIRQQ